MRRRRTAGLLLALGHARRAAGGCSGDATGPGCRAPFQGPHYTKYPAGDTYVASCNQVFEGYETSPFLEVRETGGAAYDPTDHVVDTHLCGAREMGDRVTYLLFDMSDLSFDAVGTATLRMTPDGFPPDMEARVYGAVRYAGCDNYGRKQDAIRWDTAPGEEELRDTGCRWSGDPDLLWDGNTRGCDITHDARNAAGGVLCLKITGPSATADAVQYDMARFYSRDAGDAEFKPWATAADPRRGLGRGTTGTGSVAGYEFTIAPHLRINGTNCGARFPDFEGGGCHADFGDYTKSLFTPRPTGAPLPAPTPGPVPPPSPPPSTAAPTYATGAPSLGPTT